MLRGQTLSHDLVETLAVAALAAGASTRVLGHEIRASMATVGLMAASAVTVHFFDGLIEAHYLFFVMVVVISLYQSWLPFLLALGFVAVHHGVVGTLQPLSVYDHPASQAWTWAAVHAEFILAESIACMVCWRAAENALSSERVALAAAQVAYDELAVAQELAGVASWEWDVVSGEVNWSGQMYALGGLPLDTRVSVSSFLELVQASDRDRVAALLTAAVRDTVRIDYECRIVRPDSSTIDIHAIGEFLVAADGTATKMFGTCQDITERKQLQDEIRHLALHDPLTGLANRALLLERLGHELAGETLNPSASAVLYLDLDDFKGINDSLGHSAGDQVLVEVGSRIRSVTRGHDTVARLGGDEFAVLLLGAGLPEATQAAERIRQSLQTPFSVHASDIDVRVSIGIAIARPHAGPEDVLRDADAAMYAAKRQGKDAYSVFPVLTH